MSVNGGASRRAVLLSMGAVGAAGVLAACGGADPQNPPVAPGSTPSGGGTPTSPTAGDTPQSAAPDGIPVENVPVGGGLVDPSRRVVVTQPVAGQFRAFDATCTHEFCMVTSVDAGLITCPCHGSQFRIEDGSVARGPARQPLPARNASVTDGVVVIR
jgi:Ferredoxin subunits of nitrite reductase and ring-hydroxylating dioxygenases